MLHDPLSSSTNFISKATGLLQAPTSFASQTSTSWCHGAQQVPPSVCVCVCVCLVLPMQPAQWPVREPRQQWQSFSLKLHNGVIIHGACLGRSMSSWSAIVVFTSRTSRPFLNPSLRPVLHSLCFARSCKTTVGPWGNPSDCPRFSRTSANGP